MKSREDLSECLLIVEMKSLWLGRMWMMVVKARCGYFQVILVASDCNPRTLIKYLPALAASRNVPLISVRDRKEGSLRLGELIKVKTAIAIGVKAKGNYINQLIEDALTNNKINRTEEG
ncbi:60S ribosomal protein L7a-like [Salvia splendens]|uniref:60S ribosomal protein L7a-like n=1 Tax=Salvia splendens TaxID=180675 RepID=UPI001C252B0F|nr:60S ribosomal protein L7a-like [Salvia splendens]